MSQVVKMPSGKLVCSRTGKKAFDTSGAADQRLKELGDGAKVKRSYRCPFCKRWHLTSEKFRQNRRKTVKQREGLNDGLIPARRVSRQEDAPEKRRRIEHAWEEVLGWD